MLFTPARRRSGFDLFDDFFNDPFFNTSLSQPANPLMRTDIRDDGANYLLDIELPGFKKEDIQAELKNGYLAISASHEDSKEEKDTSGKVLCQERYSGSCRRSFYVGDQLRQEDIQASFENGVLKLKFPKETPKAVEEAPRYITING
ncbi:Hsp20/alpha crystallin family protein [Clostridiaceae bacterium]|nr:Hsp20/alpha crystallin family protein [Clostridiaceae bacterium]RKI11083.1 Hsp20/alpha crystallin family protein [bacterium 1XD21-70]